MKVLVIGSGGREHAICWNIRQSPRVSELFCVPGNPGISQIATTEKIPVDDVEAILSFAIEKGIDFTVVGPELALSKGIVDCFRSAGLCIFGPVQAAAQLESSKAFAKEVMQAAGVPTADSHVFESRDTLEAFLREAKAPLVLKADGLASGKGVFVCLTQEDINRAIPELFALGAASRVLVEEYLSGVEVSYIVATDGERVVPLASSHDYKRLLDNDEGPNTGGMGSVSPTPRFNAAHEKITIEKVIEPVLREMKRRGIPFSGFLYAGLMIGSSGDIKVLEFNARLGDPETQALLRRVDASFVDVLHALASGSSLLPDLSWSTDSSVCLVIASEGYPQKPVKGDIIDGVEDAMSVPGVVVFHAGTCLQSAGRLLTDGGRVLNVTATGSSLEEARARAYQGAAVIEFRGKHMRGDIARS